MIQRIVRLISIARLAAFVALLALVGVTLAHRAAAQARPAVEASTTADIEALVKTLENDAERERLVRQLKALFDAEKVAKPRGIFMADRIVMRSLLSLSDGVSDLGTTLYGAVAFVSDLPKLFTWIGQAASDAENRARLVEIFGKLLLAVIAGSIADRLVARPLRQPLERIARSAPAGQEMSSIGHRLGLGILHGVVAAVPVIAFAVAALGVLTLVDPSLPARLLTITVVHARVAVRLIGIAAGLLIAAHAPRLRMVPVSDETASYIDLWIRRLAMIDVGGYLLSEVVTLLDLPGSISTHLLKLVGLLTGLLLVIIVLQNRVTVTSLITSPRSDTPSMSSNLRARLASSWHLLAIGYVVLLTTIWLVQPDGGFVFTVRATMTTIVALAIATLVVRWGRRSAVRALRPGEAAAQRFPDLEARANRYLSIINPIATAAVFGLAGLFILQAWGLQSLGWLLSPLGRQITGTALAVFTTLVVAIVLWEGIAVAIDRYFTRSLGHDVDGWRRRARARTLIPMVRRVVGVLLAAVSGLVILSEIGVNVTPLLALSGAVGIAVGLGAQDLIKDFLAGISILAEDSIAIGDAVQLGDKSGVVEWMSIRSLRLRSVDGTLHTVPFSEFKTVSNMTKDFSFAVFDISVSYAADVDRVMAVLRAEGAALREDAEIGPQIIADLEVFGVDRFLESAVVIRARFRTRPSQQWVVARAFNRRIKIAFDSEGIDNPFPQRTVHFVNAPANLRVARDQPSEQD